MEEQAYRGEEMGEWGGGSGDWMWEEVGQPGAVGCAWKGVLSGMLGTSSRQLLVTISLAAHSILVLL